LSNSSVCSETQGRSNSALGKAADISKKQLACQENQGIKTVLVCDISQNDSLRKIHEEICWEIIKRGPKKDKENSTGSVRALRRGDKKQINQATTSWLIVEVDERQTDATKGKPEVNDLSER
jgi:hypothetical protein